MSKKNQCFVLFCFLWIFAICCAEAYTWPTSKDQAQRSANERVDQYLQKLLSQFPEHRSIIAKLYDSYSGRIIELSEKYGEAPLLAMSEAKEDEYIALFSKPDVFNDLYLAMKSVKSKNKRAYLALKLANAMFMTNPEQDYAAELKRAKEADIAASRNGKPSHRYMDAFFAKGLFPENLLSELKKMPEKYAVLLDALSEADAAVLENIAKYPNALAFLLNAGPDGIKLIEETNGEIVILSYIMTNESQARLPALFKEHRLLAEALASCGAEAFFAITAAPKFYFALASSFRVEVNNRYYVAYAVLASMIEAETTTEINAACDFLNNLSQEETRRIARLTAELLEAKISGAEDDTPIAVAPFFDPWYIRFIHKYDWAAVDICAEFGDMVNVATLLMKDWKGDLRNVSPIIEAIRDYNALGLNAAMMFQYNDYMQSIILDPAWGSRHKELLMLLFYDSFMDLSANMSDWKKISQKLLEDYKAESRTGEPISKKGTQLREFIPGYDVVKPVYDMVKYGKTPTVGDFFMGALDFAIFLPGAVAASTLVKEIGKNGIKRLPGYIMNTPMVKNLANIPSRLKGVLGDTLDAVKNLSLKEFRQQTGRVVKNVADAMGNLSKVDTWAIISRLRPNADILSDLWSSSQKFAVGTARRFAYIAKPVHEWLNDVRKLYPTLRSDPKRATDVFANFLITEAVLQPTLFYAGTLSICNYIESRQFSVSIK